MIQEIIHHLPENHPWQDKITYYDLIPSTNDLAKEMAKAHAPEGTVLVAAAQSAGRGRMGRSFYAPAGLGLYFSLILRPMCPPEQLLHLTCATAVAACDAVETLTGFRPQIKWTNDLVAKGKKLGGILTELSVSRKTGLVEWAVIGIGINCCHQKNDFPTELQDMATSLLQITGNPFSPNHLAAYLTESFYRMNEKLLSQRDAIIQSYCQDCMTVGKEIVLIRGDEKRYGLAMDIANDGGLVVRFQDGTTETVQSGEVSVRGLYGYV